MRIRTRSLLSALVIVCAVAAGMPAIAHPPWNPYDNTRFAPVTRFGPSIGIEVVTRGVNDPLTGAPVGPVLTSPLKAVPAPGLPNYMFIVDQPGILWVVNLMTGVRTKFLDLSPTGPTPLVVPLGVCGPNTFDERGLLGVAFHPKFQENGKFYTYTSEDVELGIPATIPKAVPFDPDHQNVVSEWVVNPAGRTDPTVAVIGPRRELLRVDWPQFNHDGGDLGFGPDGKLYISMGDGGGADDADGQPFVLARPKFPQASDCSLAADIDGHQGNGNGQRLNTALGKIHRIDVDAPFTAGKQYRIPDDNPFVGAPGNVVKEIWGYGFRNPYRFSFDRGTGKLYVGDVGQNDIEEVDVVKRGGNHGWNCKEGTLFFLINGSVPDDGTASATPDPARPECNPRTTRFVDPVAQHDTHHEGHSVVGGFVYQGAAVHALRGKYVYGDFSLLFKFPRGPHDYGRVFAFDVGDGHRGRDDRGLRRISELLVLPGGSLSLALLGTGEDTAGEIYLMGNVSGLPFGNGGVVVRITPAPRLRVDDDDDDPRGRGHGGHD